MGLINQMMSYDKSKNVNLGTSKIEKDCNCEECKSVILQNFNASDEFIIKLENYHLMCREKEIMNTMNLEYWYKDYKTKNFIWKSLHIHGDKYIYHKTVYVKYKEKVWIECGNGHTFEQKPREHLNNKGCSSCSGTKKLTTKEFIEKARKIHGNKYDYSKVIYKNNHTKVIIICKEHGDFKQKPNDHLNGQGCLICGIQKRNFKNSLSLDEFIKLARKTHENKYDYSKVIYKNNHTKIIITCRKHGDFKQKPHDHLQGEGCPLCNESLGESKIRIFLTKNNINFEKEKRFNDCKDSKPLPFDFYLPHYNICIEFDGSQHFNPHAFNSRKVSDEIKLKNLKYIQNHDRIKNEYCKNKGIILLRFNNLKTVEQDLMKYFQNRGIIEQTIFNL